MRAGVITKTACRSCRLVHKKIDVSINLPTLSEVFSGLEGVSILGGNQAEGDSNRFSYWAAEPLEIFEFKTGEEKPFEKLEHVLAKYKLESNKVRDCRASHLGHKLAMTGGCDDLPEGIFCGGWVGYFSYELAGYIEKLPETMVDDLQMPLIRLGFYDRVICYDHEEKEFRLIVLELDGDSESAEEKMSGLERLLARAGNICVSAPAAGNLDDIDFSQIKSNMKRGYYLDAIERIRHYIYDGQVYQVNFSQRFECDYDANPIKLYHWQNCYNASSYAAYIDGGDFQIVSASPEMFVTMNKRQISTKPIKGTRRRVSDEGDGAKTNAKNFQDLSSSEKEQAELNMIVDLERNDLARICRAGTRKVVQKRTIESYPTVFHAVATVAGELAADVGFCDILKAMFPGGSITGAPKVSSMEIIDELEPTQRGVYTGSVGFIGVDGNAGLNIAIRTIIIKNKKAYAQAGGGIVIDSKAEAEWDEMLTKARALLAGIKAVNSEAEDLKRKVQRVQQVAHPTSGIKAVQEKYING